MSSSNIHTIGAGGGSLAYAGGRRSARRARRAPAPLPARPATAAAGREPTVTDANVVLGRVDPAYFAGGRMALDTSAAERSMASLAEELGLGSAGDWREGILDVDQRPDGAGHPHPDRGAGDRAARLRARRLRRRRADARRVPRRELEIAEVIVPPLPGGLLRLGHAADGDPQDFSRRSTRRAAGADLEQLEALRGDSRRRRATRCTRGRRRRGHANGATRSTSATSARNTRSDPALAGEVRAGTASSTRSPSDSTLRTTLATGTRTGRPGRVRRDSRTSASASWSGRSRGRSPTGRSAPARGVDA